MENKSDNFGEKVSSGFKNWNKLKFSGGQSASGDASSSQKSNTGLVGAAAANLQSAEAAASESLSKTDDSLSGIRAAESKTGGFYKGGIKKLTASKGRQKDLKGRFKKASPLLGIVLAIFGIGAVSFNTVSTEIVAWKENVSSTFGQNSAVINRRSNTIMRRLLSTHYDTTSNTIFGQKFQIGSKLSQKLKDKNIHYVETNGTDGKKLKMLVFEEPDGRVTPIVASDSDLSRVGTSADIDGRRVNFTEPGVTLSNARKNNKNFATNYDTATITFTGKIAGWFDNMADSMYKRLIGENARNQTDIDDPDQEKVDDMLLGNKSSGVDDSDLRATDPDAEDANGNKLADVEFDDGEGGHKSFADVEAENGKIAVTSDTSVPDNVESGLKVKAQKAAMVSATVGCAFLRGIGAISAAVGAVQTINVINYASKYLEIADKIKAGKADEVTHISLNNLNTSVKTYAYDIDGNKEEIEGAVTESSGWNAPFASKNIIDENDPSALIVNREYANKNALRSTIGSGVLSDVVGTVAGFGAGITAFKACTGIQITAGVVDAFSDFVALFTGGIAKLVKEVIGGAIKGAALAGAMVLVTSVISAVTPMVSQWFAGKLSNAFLGKNGGFALLSGSQNILNSNLQMSTGRYANKENAVEVFALTKDVEREWAAYERATRSPFDITSKYTFFGSIYNSALPIIHSADNNIVSAASSVADLTRHSALAAISPSASAASETGDYAISLASDGNCSYLKSVDVAGDFACNKYAGAYVDELTTLDPETVYEKIKDNFEGEDSDGNPKIKKDSDYAKYIVACVSSDNQPGTMSTAVQTYIEQAQEAVTGGNVVANGLVNFGTNFIPFEGIVDAFDGAGQLKNVDWNSGYACTGNTGNAELDQNVKYYSMYNLDQRVMYDMGIIENNSTVSFLEDYYKENPLDQSFEGQIARVSGMSKAEVNDALALVDYYQFIANYDPSERYAFGAPAIKIDNSLNFKNEYRLASAPVLLDQIVYADVRNRSFAV